MSRRRLMLNPPNNILYQLKNFQFDGNTIIDTGIKLMALDYDWKISGKVSRPIGTAPHYFILDCNNEATTTTYGKSANGLVVRNVSNNSMFEIKVGSPSVTTELDTHLSGSDIVRSNSYGRALRRPLTSDSTEVEFEIVKRGTEITITLGSTYYKLRWTGATQKNLYIGANLVESSGVIRRYFNGYIYYIILEKI